jgi:hypothetical protein
VKFLLLIVGGGNKGFSRAASKRNAGYFADHLPQNEYWRFFNPFGESTAYLNVELPHWIRGIKGYIP